MGISRAKSVGYNGVGRILEGKGVWLGLINMDYDGNFNCFNYKNLAIGVGNLENMNPIPLISGKTYFLIAEGSPYQS